MRVGGGGGEWGMLATVVRSLVVATVQSILSSQKQIMGRGSVVVAVAVAVVVGGLSRR